ncbi:competence type IV pilus major pilin ComGC [Psychrobacillus sp.]|uniref:competence type IV pilus major pilin ComGC n=1 Tax=Psychrobacillus sp. TaxID=1871623 RepID=UPI0028BEE5CC|nr:competence type IV pilus major pilin ComGC [Psychrobacillus sp.]
MMIVLLIISVLILITIPNVTKHSANIDDKGCKAFAKMLEGQIEAYKIEFKKIPTLDDLETEGYLKGEKTCPNGKEVTIDSVDGKVTIEGETAVGTDPSGI